MHYRIVADRSMPPPTSRFGVCKRTGALFMRIEVGLRVWDQKVDVVCVAPGDARFTDGPKPGSDGRRPTSDFAWLPEGTTLEVVL